MCILELSKVPMHKFHYAQMKNNCSNKDTNGLLYEIETENIYNNFSKSKELFDFISNSTKSKITMIQMHSLLVKLKMN